MHARPCCNGVRPGLSFSTRTKDSILENHFYIIDIKPCILYLLCLRGVFGHYACRHSKLRILPRRRASDSECKHFDLLSRLGHAFLPTSLTNFDADSDQFIFFRSYTEILLTGDMLMGFNACLCFIKLIFYMSLSHHFAIVTLTLTQSAKAVVGFLVVEGITMAGFASMFMVTFGTKVFNYKTFSETSYTLILALLGDADLSELREANWYAGPITYVSKYLWY